MYIPFNPTKEYHKYPLGAVKEKTQVTFRIVLPRDFCCTGARVVITKDGEDKCRYSMWWDCMEGNNEEWWKFQLPIENPGLYFYHFEYDTSFGVSKIFRHRDSLDGCFAPSGEEWQITVYSESFDTPHWLRGGIIYQIFPDRFYNSGKEKSDVPDDRILRTDFGGEPYWRPDKNGKVLNNDYFGGDLKGIEEKLPYLSSLGVSCIYLNPIFEAQSNHRYDTADYKKIDPLLGDESDFVSLCQKAEEFGIKIILDGVFSHTGCDSRYFNKKSRYPDLGAFQSKESPYFNWYKFTEWPDKYQSWWGIDILPEIIEENPDFINYISGKNGVLEKWLSLGAAGWRLDVADELPDEFLDALRKSVKAFKSDALIIGEVWEDASNKSSYGKRRRYLQGDQLDSVMNYPFAEAIIDFVRFGNAESFEKTVSTVIENYPKPVIDVLMNHIGTHDTMRVITALAGESCEYRDRHWQSRTKLSAEQYKKGVKLLKLASIIQYTLPGVPSLYYGDEAGMEGYKDPFNRFCYPWGRENIELIDFYKALGRMRKNCDCFKEGSYRTVSAMLSCLAFERYGKKDKVLVIINRNEHEIDYYLPSEWHNAQCIFGKEMQGDKAHLGALEGIILKVES